MTTPVASDWVESADSPPTLGPGQQYAPQHREQPRPTARYVDSDAARVQSTSVHAGRPIMQETSSVGMGVYYGLRSESLRKPVPRSSLDPPQPASIDEALHLDEERRLSGESRERLESIFLPKHDALSPSNASGVSPQGSSTTDKLSFEKQLKLDVKQLEYYHGTAKYPELLNKFRDKYQNYNSNQFQGKSMPTKANDSRETKEPVDYQHLSEKLKAQLYTGPHSYHPISLMEQHGVFRFQGYAFPPSLELGNLKSELDLTKLHASYQSKGVLALLRRSFNALVGLPDTRDAYLATYDRAKEDKHIIYRTLGLDAVQRRQMRFMLSDFDHADRHTSFHVMMTYPYADWLHVFFMVFVGWCLYKLQLHLNAYDFYDEYLGLDLRQVPSLKKPFLVIMTTVVMVFFFSSRSCWQALPQIELIEFL
ncbi:unnamed protein product [Phytomonas sp. Hart1]|nr:unnamed protein product [Phytomonas sp. Hart1]|eukprot:CCW67401.1 unnamed protein product [Phytomonas sp. isolate Hart1]